jgi:small subunit ribosomal protein S15
MTLSKDEKSNIVESYGRNREDTGSPEVQIALLSARITQLTEHLKLHQKDHHSRRGLLKLVGQRRRHMRYLQRRNAADYSALIKRLGLRG